MGHSCIVVSSYFADGLIVKLVEKIVENHFLLRRGNYVLNITRQVIILHVLFKLLFRFVNTCILSVSCLNVIFVY